jgi:predicted glycosyltransferase
LGTYGCHAKELLHYLKSIHPKKLILNGDIIDIWQFSKSYWPFISSMCRARAVLCGAGFETPAEALYLGKKLMVIPMKHQFEQHCNAAALADLRVPVLKNLKMKQLPKIEHWLQSSDAIKVDYLNHTESLVLRLLEEAEVYLSKPSPKFMGSTAAY